MNNTIPLPVLAAENQQQIPAAASHTDGLLQLAIQQGMPVESLKELVALRNDELKRLAKAAYVRAMAKFQALVPVIEKTKKVGFEHRDGAGRTDYRYAPLWKIAETIKDALRECDLSYRWEIQDKQEGAANIITVTCIVTHVDGHSEQNPMSGAPDPSGKKNAIQQRGSTITYLQRYTLIGALGLTTADEDNDGRDADHEEETISEAQHTALHAILTDAGIEGEKATRQLSNLAKAVCGHSNACDIPASKFEEAKEKLKAGLAARNGR
jgi:hypothetical protein